MDPLDTLGLSGAQAVAEAERLLRHAAASDAKRDRPAADMQLLLAIVHEEDATAATEALNRGGLRVTQIASSGGFLRKGSVILLVGLAREQVPAALAVLRASCAARTEVSVPVLATGLVGQSIMAPVLVHAGGATVFVLDVERYERL
jgi:uncharacterized protein YaaQ